MGQANDSPTQWTTLLGTPCSDAHLGRVTTACVSSPWRLGCLDWLGYAAEHGHFSSASTSRRTPFPLVEAVHVSFLDSKIWRQFSLRRGSPECVLQGVFYAPPGVFWSDSEQLAPRQCEITPPRKKKRARNCGPQIILKKIFEMGVKIFAHEYHFENFSGHQELFIEPYDVQKRKT